MISPGSVATLTGCAVTASGTLTGTSFTVGSVPASTYVITVTGSSGDFAQATFTVIGPTIVLTPTSGPAGLVVTVNGNNFAPADYGLGCTIAGTAVAALPVPACTVSGSGTLTASSFTVDTVAPGAYTITVTGNSGDFGQATFVVSTASPTITLTPNSGPAGITVTVTGSGFAPADAAAACTFSPASVAILIGCTVTASGSLTGSSFTVGNVAAGTYTIRVQGSTGDVAQASFTVKAKHYS